MSKAGQPQETQASGLVLVDKDQAMTSHDVVARVRRLAGTRKVGHAGTLDPMATGVLVVGVNKATRLLTYIVGHDKTYTATIRLGQSTVTDDAEGEILSERIAAAVTEEDIEREVSKLRGDIEQVPSQVSAIKVDGKRSYARVREGQQVELKARPVTISRFDILQVRREHGGKIIDVDVIVSCSSGTYIRALARDVGEALNVGGHLTALRRTEVGPYNISQTKRLAELAEEFEMLPLDEAAAALFPNRTVSVDEAVELSFGRTIAASSSVMDVTKDEIVAAFAPNGTLVALLKDQGAKARTQLVFTAK
ncbi:tRNA pseudouridine(55) synthase TruB [Glutamicibacter sp. V16R2B1]|uniref:tRNA pseudouridine(55) synthase TruB n=1 Tax=Glutamicibacter sp. V16R2B1 TaxID=2036207 RepID=UPI0010FE7B8F|nr:tRNA pseudouridine(55) synthase TruB [Glutamicibacter sp. V16R2B1]TLK57075.1 tRNA pseudouridine(55) synthase TruB [Glutamicibacter sp. V16R2B1]